MQGCPQQQHKQAKKSANLAFRAEERSKLLLLPTRSELAHHHDAMLLLGITFCIHHAH